MITPFSVEELEKSVLSALGISSKETLKEWESNSYLIDRSLVDNFWSYVKKAPAVGIVGDYDTDGICGCYVFGKSVKAVCPDKKMIIRIPRRFSEGYGINETIRQEINEKLPKGSVIITVDNGIAAKDVLEGLEKDGYVVLMTDHHEKKEDKGIPNVTVAINPSVPELSKGFSFKGWCGAAVAYKLAEQVVPKELAKELEVFAGLATVADCMKLKGANWGLARRAILAFREGKAPASLAAMLTAMGQDPLFANGDSFGYYLAPCFNAPGRLKDQGASLVLKYLFNPTKAGLDELIALNNERKKLRDEELALVEKAIKDQGKENDFPIYAHVPGLHEGIVGIIAGRIAEEYKAPALICTTKENDPHMYVGSARSYGDFNVFEYMTSISDLFARWGGHEGAAGFSLTDENFKKAELMQVSRPEFLENIDSFESIKEEDIPLINKELMGLMPFGEGNPTPLFVLDVDILGKDNVFIGKALTLEDGQPLRDRNGSEVKPHLCIKGKDPHGENFKITNFGHNPEHLGVSRFRLFGKVSGTSYMGVETPTFNADSIEEL